MESVLHKMRFLKKDMGPAEKKISEYITSSPHEILSMSITELAEKCGCGDATVVRFSRRLGFTGFQALKIGIAGELNSASAISETVTKNDSCFDIFKKRITDISVALNNTENVLDAAELEKAANKIMNASRIVIFGLGNSAAIATDAAHKFLRLGLPAQSCCDNHLQAIIASHLDRKTVVVAISHSGSSRDIVDAVQLSKMSGATVISITNVGVSPLTENSDICLFTKSEETKYSLLAMNSRIAQLAIFDAIYTYIVVNLDREAQNAIYNTEVALRNKKY